MKSALKIISVFFAALFILGACSNIPDEPATSSAKEYTYIDPVSATYPIPENADEFPDATFPIKYVEGPVNVECIISSYYVDGNSVARIESVSLDRQPGSARTSGALTVTIDAIGSRKNGMRIAYTCYDAQGNPISEDFSTRAELKDVKKGDTVLMPISLVDGTAKIVFSNYGDK